MSLDHLINHVQFSSTLASSIFVPMMETLLLSVSLCFSPNLRPSQSIMFVNCGPGLDRSTSIAKALAKVTLCNGQVRESLKSVDMQGCVFNKSFGWICDALDDLEHLEYVNLRDCELTQSQKDKIEYKLGIKKRENPPLVYLDWDDDVVLLDSTASNDEDEAYEFEYSQAFP